MRLNKPAQIDPAAAPPGAEADLRDPSLYINQELSLLDFQRRVLEEAWDSRNPVLERVKFLAIVGSNLDEFFMVRVASLTEQLEAGILEFGPDHMSPAAQLQAIRREVVRLLADANKCLRSELLPALAAEGIHVIEYEELGESQRSTANRYFEETIFPVLTPLAFDPGRPFPHISNLSLNLAVLIRQPGGDRRFARVKVPDLLPQLVPITRFRQKAKARREEEFVWIEQIIAANLPALFPGMEVLESHPFHVTRDADLDIKELEAEDLLESIEESVRQRRFGSVSRLNVQAGMPRHILTILMRNLEVDRRDIYHARGLLGLSRLMALCRLDRPELKYKTFVPSLPPELDRKEDEDIFSIIRRGDVLLHHPFDSFDPVVQFLSRAAHDPDVLAIKIVLYRVGRNSPVVKALLEAVEEGKQVAVLMELKARFDEESNIEWAKALERAGAHVVYGLLGLKCHCKIALIVRSENGHIRRYVHLATGNYNAVTAHLYTDMGLFTADEDITADASDLFNYLTGYSRKSDYRKLLVSPICLRERLRELIDREIEHRRAGRPARLLFKMNSLVDARMIRRLYQASRAGVPVELLVRGKCCLRPGVPGVSENIRVTSIVGRFLEHSRIYCFANGGAGEIYLGSADLMPRNLDSRVETLFPIESPEIRARLERIIEVYLADNTKARRMNADGSYYILRPGKAPAVNAQRELIPNQPRTSLALATARDRV